MEGSPICSHLVSLAIKFLPTYTPNSTFLVSPTPTDSHQALPRINTQPQQSTNNLLHHLYTYTLLLPLGTSTCFTPESPLLFYAYTNINYKDGSKNSAMIAVATDIFATNMQPYPQPTSPLKSDPPFDKESFHRIVTHGESYRTFTSPPQTAFSDISL